MLATVAFANENPQEDGVFRKVHKWFLFRQYCESKNASKPDGCKTANK
jgi:hypothetical protein